jgi:SAM-dependent methyltransferase
MHPDDQQDDQRDDQRALLHRHGTPGTWGNLGCWPAPDYAAACTALARRVGQAARLGPGQRVCSLACGAGDELWLWVREFGVAHASGTDRDAQALALAGEDPRIALRSADGRRLGFPPASPGGFDAVLCVDAAYHLSPRRDFIDGAWQALRPGGWLAFTDLVVDGPRAWTLRGAARLCGVPVDDLGPASARLSQLAQAGFTQASAERLDDAVLGGFVDFVRTQRRRLGPDARGPGWRRVAVTAALVGPCRAAGLGYALFAARKP